MAWGRGGSGIEELVSRVARDDPSLTSLTLLRSRRFGEPEAAALAGALASNCSLRELNAPSHALSAASAAALAAALRAQPEPGLRSLCVGDSGFGDAALAALAPGLGRLLELDVECKGLGAAGGATLGALLAAQPPRLLELRAARNPGLGCAGGCALADTAAAGPGPAPLRLLDLSGCALQSSCGAALARLLASERGGALAELRLCDNPGLGREGLAPLAAALPAAAALRSLLLDGCGCGGGGGSLVAALASAPRLLSLSLARCGLDADDACALGQALAARPAEARLRALSLAGNSAVGGGGAEAAAAAAAALAGARLEELDAAGCALPAAAAEALLGAEGLVNLSLLGNPLGCGGVAALAARLESGPPLLRSLNLSGTGMDAEGAAALLAALAHPAAAPSLACLEVGANPGAAARPAPAEGAAEAPPDESVWAWEAALAALREARPGLDVAWRVADSGAGAVPEGLRAALG